MSEATNAEYVSKLHEDLKKRLDRLCWTHNEPALHVAQRFAELRAQVDYDAERISNEIQTIKREAGKARKDDDVNQVRLEFIRILEELEKRNALEPKPQTPASEVYASLEQRVDEFKSSSSSLDDLEDSYVHLAQEIIDETERIQKRIFGEQTIIYWPHKNESKLGSLVYIGDVFLSQRDIDRLLSEAFPYKQTHQCQRSVANSLLVPANKSYEQSKKELVIKRLAEDDLSRFAEASKFFYVGKTKKEYSGYSAKGSRVEREFVSYQFNTHSDPLWIHSFECVNTSANLFDVYSSSSCFLGIYNQRLESLNTNLLPSPASRLTKLELIGVHLESFDTTLLAQFTNLTELKLHVIFSKDSEFDLEFLGPLRKLESLGLTLPGSSWDFSVLEDKTKLSYLKLEGSSYLYAEKLPRLSKTALAQILSPPELQSLKLSYFDIETIDRDLFKGCRRLDALKLACNRIGDSNEDGCSHVGFPLCFVNPMERVRENGFSKFSLDLVHSGIRALSAASFSGMTRLRSLSLKGNSIVDLPRGVFDNLPSLAGLHLDKNLIRNINCGVFGKLYNLNWLTMSGNPIETIEPNAFAELGHVSYLFMDGCRLKSIDNKMLNGLRNLHEFKLSNNLIERIEVVTENGRRINVAKANLNNKERSLARKYLFKDLSRLLILHLNGNKLEKLDLNCFYNLTLCHLHLSSNKINELSGKFKGGPFSNLGELYLNDNQLTTIDNSALPENLCHIDLSKNKLKRIDKNFVRKFESLRCFKFSENEITWDDTDSEDASNSDDEEDLSWLGSLEVCDSSEDSIKSLTRFPALTTEPEPTQTDPYNLSWLRNARKLKEMNFSKNLIETLEDPDLFSGLIWVTTINLSTNRLTSIHRDIFKCMPRLETINLSGNQLTSIDTGLFRHLKSLRHLNLSSNGISFINLARLFRVCSELKSLNLADNLLDDRSTAKSINNVPSFYPDTLVLVNNRFQTMDFVRDMINLRHLDLRGNQIESVMSKGGENLLGRLRELTHLDLSDNKISPLKDEMFVHLLLKLEHLNISGNPLDSFQLDSVLSELI